MLPKRHRLTRTRDFARARRFGRSASTPLLVLYALPNRSTEIRVGFSVSKKVGGAVVRNRVKRLLREAVRRYLPTVREGLDLVFIARPAAAGATFDQICDLVATLLRKTASTMRVTREASNA